MNVKISAVLCGVLLLTSACGRSSDERTADSAETLDQAATPVDRSAEKPATAKSPKADASVAEDRYISIDSGNQVMFLYYGLSGMPPDYDAIARAYSSDYRSTSDAFRKQDILSAIKPRIEGHIADASTQRYFIYEIDPNLDHYDFTAKAFPVRNMADGVNWYVNDNSDYKLSFNNWDEFNELSVTDETIARQIEQLVGSFRSFSLLVYGFAQEVDLNQKVVKAQVVKVVLRDARGNTLATN